MFRFAIVRDPIKRLLSTWRNKLSCDDDPVNNQGVYAVDPGDRPRIARRLLDRLGWRKNGKIGSDLEKDEKSCFSVDEFVDAIHALFLKKGSFSFDDHMAPQVQPERNEMSCFSNGLLPRDYNAICDL